MQFLYLLEIEASVYAKEIDIQAVTNAKATIL